MSVTGRPEGYVMCVRGEEQARQTGKGEGREEGEAGGREKKRKEERKQEKGKKRGGGGRGRPVLSRLWPRPRIPLPAQYVRLDSQVLL